MENLNEQENREAYIKPNIQLYPDYVILKENNDFDRFEEGQIRLYAEKEDAEKDKVKGDKVVNVFDLSEEQQNIIKENIIDFSLEQYIILDKNDDFVRNDKGKVYFFDNPKDALNIAKQNEKVYHYLNLSDKQKIAYQNEISIVVTKKLENMEQTSQAPAQETNKILEKTNEKGQVEATLKVWENGKAEKTDYTYSENGTLQETKEYFGTRS